MARRCSEDLNIQSGTKSYVQSDDERMRLSKSHAVWCANLIGNDPLIEQLSCFTDCVF